MNDDVSKPMAAVIAYTLAASAPPGVRASSAASRYAAVKQAIRLSNAQAVVSVLERARANAEASNASLRGYLLLCADLAAWKAEVARLQGDA